MKHLLSGNEAIARGAYEAGVRVCSAYPGTPSTEIFEQLPQYQDELYCEWAPNEKVAAEVAYGAAIAVLSLSRQTTPACILRRTNRITDIMPGSQRSH